MTFTDEQLDRFRRSGIRLDVSGRFWHEGGEITHPGLRAALWRWLDQNPDGRYVLRLDADRFVWLEVEDAPHLVRSLRWEDERAIAHLADGMEEPLDLATIRLVSSGAAFARVKNGRFDARLLPAAWAALAGHIEEHDGTAFLVAAGMAHRLGPVTSDDAATITE